MLYCRSTNLAVGSTVGDGELTMRELGQRGGRKTSERHGSEFFKRIGSKGGAASAAKYDHEHFTEIGRKGGQRTSEMFAKYKALEAAESGEEG